VLMQAFYILKHLPVKLLVVGSGSLEDTIKQKVRDLGIAEKVVFLGFDNNPYKYLQRSDCFVLSSYVEGFPNVLLEALACGKAIVSTDCKSGPREILAPGSDLSHEAITSYEITEHGILAPVHDVANLAAAMIRMYEDDDLRNNFESKALARAEVFDIEKIRQYFHVAFSG
jgi:N-acetylgalactosamine-N,N'-diacetylbacillosaminyl-diphospho-undecaprenol 4-alpha-N-acetylgalactosaminyltransferase